MVELSVTAWVPTYFTETVFYKCLIKLCNIMLFDLIIVKYIRLNLKKNEFWIYKGTSYVICFVTLCRTKQENTEPNTVYSRFKSLVEWLENIQLPLAYGKCWLLKSRQQLFSLPFFYRDRWLWWFAYYALFSLYNIFSYVLYIVYIYYAVS